MRNTRTILLGVAFISIGLLAYALYLQHVKEMLPCPLCILQRYAFLAVALICLLFASMPERVVRIGAGAAALASMAGAAIAGRHLYVLANPSASCGIDPLENALNELPTARLIPAMFKADGLCTADYAPIFGLSIPEWALIWFVILSLALLAAAFVRNR